MNTKTFNENFTVDRKSRGVKALPKDAPTLPETVAADGTIYDAGEVYHFFDEASRQIRDSTGFRRIGEHLCAFGLKIAAVGALHTNRDDALSDAQKFFNAEIEQLRERIRHCEAEKRPANRSLKAVLMAK